MEWQTIETAPKDGTRVIVFDGDNTYCSEFQNDYLNFGVPSGGRWMIYLYDSGDGDVHEEIYPTHWIPFPTPPLYG